MVLVIIAVIISVFGTFVITRAAMQVGGIGNGVKQQFSTPSKPDSTQGYVSLIVVSDERGGRNG